MGTPFHYARYLKVAKLADVAASNRELSEKEFRAIMLKYQNYRPLYRQVGDLRGFISWLWAEAYDVGMADGHARERLLIDKEGGLK